MALLFFAIEGFTVPNFFEFVYYYAMNEAHMTQTEWGYSMVGTSISFLVTIVIYANFLNGREPRHLIALCLVFFFLSAIFQLTFVKGYYTVL